MHHIQCNCCKLFIAERAYDFHILRCEPKPYTDPLAPEPANPYRIVNGKRERV